MTALRPIRQNIDKSRDLSVYVDSLVEVLKYNFDQLFQELSKIYSGTYTPVLSNSTNVAASTPRNFHYTRIGNEVTVTGLINLTFTAGATASTVFISLPIASNLGNAYDLSGLASHGSGNYGNGVLYADFANDRAEMDCIAVNTTSELWGIKFTYTVKQ